MIIYKRAYECIHPDIRTPKIQVYNYSVFERGDFWELTDEEILVRWEIPDISLQTLSAASHLNTDIECR